MTIEIDGVTLHLAHPDELAVQWVGQDELMRQLLAAWMVVNDQDLPMNPRLLGKPGVGKTTLAYAAARRMGREVYILQATMDTRPEDLLVTPVIFGAGVHGGLQDVDLAPHAPGGGMSQGGLAHARFAQ